MTADLGLEPWVQLPGWVTEEEVFRQLASADLGVDTSLQQEVSPVKAMEYMAFGLPFAAFDLVETRRTAEGAAALVEPGDIEALATTVLRLADDPEERARLGECGRQRVERVLAWERQSPVYLAAVSPDPPIRRQRFPREPGRLPIRVRS
jgi:glycosyltransferase involved in cell wall biosynthesis